MLASFVTLTPSPQILQSGKRVCKSEMRDIQLDLSQPVLPTADLGIRFPEHFRTIFRAREIIIDVISTNDRRNRKEVVDSIF